MAREKRQEGYMLQLSEARSHSCGLSGDQEQTFYLQETLQKEDSYRHLRLGE